MATPPYPIPRPEKFDMEEMKTIVERMNRSLIDIYQKFPTAPGLTTEKTVLVPQASLLNVFNNINGQLNTKQPALGFTPENSANKNQPNGYAGLDAFGVILSSELPPMAYGSMWIYDLGVNPVSVPIAATDTFYEVSAGISGGVITQGFIMQSSRELVCQVSGVYEANWHMSLDAGNNNQEVEGAIMVGTSALQFTAAHAEVINAGKPVAVGGTGIIRLSPNDLVKVCVLNHTATNPITIDHMTCSVLRVGA